MPISRASAASALYVIATYVTSVSPISQTAHYSPTFHRMHAALLLVASLQRLARCPMRHHRRHRTACIQHNEWSRLHQCHWYDVSHVHWLLHTENYRAGCTFRLVILCESNPALMLLFGTDTHCCLVLITLLLGRVTPQLQSAAPARALLVRLWM